MGTSVWPWGSRCSNTRSPFWFKLELDWSRALMSRLIALWIFVILGFMERDRSRSPYVRGGWRQRAARKAEVRGPRVPGPEEDAKTDADDDGGEEFHDHVAKLYLRNKMSADQTAKLVQKAHKAGARGMDEMKKSPGTVPRHANMGLPRGRRDKTSRNIRKQTS